MLCPTGMPANAVLNGPAARTYNDERVLCGAKHAVFGQSVLDLILLDDHVLLQHFDGVQRFGGLFTAQNHFTECSFAQHF